MCDVLIIGCGNRQRGDDAAGITAAERLRAHGIAVEVCAGEFSELMELWSGVSDVIVIDCITTGAPAGTVQVWDALHLPRISNVSGSTHGFGVGEAIGMGRALGSLPQRLLIYGIEGKNFEVGSQISSEVEKAIEEVVDRIARNVKA